MEECCGGGRHSLCRVLLSAREVHRHSAALSPTPKRMAPNLKAQVKATLKMLVFSNFLPQPYGWFHTSWPWRPPPVGRSLPQTQNTMGGQWPMLTAIWGLLGHMESRWGSSTPQPTERAKPTFIQESQVPRSLKWRPSLSLRWWTWNFRDATNSKTSWQRRPRFGGLKYSVGCVRHASVPHSGTPHMGVLRLENWRIVIMLIQCKKQNPKVRIAVKGRRDNLETLASHARQG